MAKKRIIICALIVFGVSFWVLQSAGEAATISVDCAAAQTIQAAITTASSGDTISVTGTCNENINTTFKAALTLDGNTTAVIHGPDSANPTVAVRAAGTTIKRFGAISGGQDGIMIFGSGTAAIENNTIQSTARDGILVSGGGSATINTNTIQSTARDGIRVVQSSEATIVNNTITNNPEDGIHVADGSAVRIGFITDEDTVASPNTITTNGGDGINVSQSSNARIVGNNINDNTGNGVTVMKLSHADISDNTINQNGNDGIEVSQGSGANLGSDTGTGIFDSPNTTTVNNTDRGIECSIGGYVDGRLGSLNGKRGSKATSKGCFNSLTK